MLALALVFALAGPVRAQSITATVLEDNGATSNANNDPGSTGDGEQDVFITPINHPGVLATGGGAAGTGYDFSSSYAGFTQASFLSLSLTMIDGNSASAAQEGAQTDDFDFNHLVLYLGGTYNATTGQLTGGTEVTKLNGTPLYLNGFRGGGLQDTMTFADIPLSAATGSAIITLLNGDSGFLTAFVGTDNTNDSSAALGGAVGNGPNEIFVGSQLRASTTTLTLSAVPEPGPTSLLLGAGGVVLLAARRRRSLNARSPFQL